MVPQPATPKQAKILIKRQFDKAERLAKDQDRRPAANFGTASKSDVGRLAESVSRFRKNIFHSGVSLFLFSFCSQ